MDLTQSYFLVRQFAREIQPFLEGGTLLECFSNSPQQFTVWVETSGKICSLAFDFTPNALYYRFFEDEIAKAKTWNPQFRDAQQLPILGVMPHQSDRSFSLRTNGGALVFMAYGGASNILWIPTEGETDAFRKNRSNDLKARLSDWSLDETEIPSSFWESTVGKKWTKNWTSDDLLAASKQSTWHWEKDENGFLTLQPAGKPQPLLETLRQGIGKVLAINKKQQAFLSAKKTIDSQWIQAKSRKEKVEARWLELAESGKYEHWGHLLMAHLPKILEGSKSVELIDYLTQKPIKIPLKTDLSPLKNAERYFRKAKNEKLEESFVAADLERVTQRLAELSVQKEKLESGQFNDSDWKTWGQENRKKEQNESLPFLRFEHAGHEIWVGKNAGNNDELLRAAKPNDHWLHAYGSGGSHVIIKNPQKKTPSSAAVQFAAALAAKYSKQRGSESVPVQFTQRKFVRKRKGSAPGLVAVDRFETIFVDWREVLESQ
jgi:hypothetical protein